MNTWEYTASKGFINKHHYPFGLTMAGISSKSIGIMPNKKKFNDGTELQSNEFSDGSGLEWYSTDFRTYDSQLGRLWQIDPLSEITYNISPYAYSNNNPIFFNDPTGLLSDSSHPIILSEVIVISKPSKVNKAIDNSNTWLNWTSLGWSGCEASKKFTYLGDWTYRTSDGIVQTVFDTKWGANKTPRKPG